MLQLALPAEFSDLAVNQAKVHLVDHSSTVLAPFSKESQAYATEVLNGRGVQLHLGLLVKEVYENHVVLSNGDTIPTHTVIWAGGLKAPPLAEKSGLPQGHGGRINIQPDFTVEGFPDIFVLGDMANIPGGAEGRGLPQLASVAKQSGEWAAHNIVARLHGKQTTPFQYRDKGIMAMIGRNAAIAEIGEKRHHLKGFFAYVSWLMVHAALLSTFRQKMGAVIAWAWDYFGHTEALQILDREDAAHIILPNNKVR
jgi:NADH dehydrogenase